MSQPQLGPIAFPNIIGDRPRLYTQATRSQLSLESNFLQSKTSLSEKAEADLTEDQLRELYDNEEIDRFLNLFSTFVTEVRAPDTPVSAEGEASEYVSEETANSIATRSSEDDGEWTPPSDSAIDGESIPASSTSPKHNSLSEEIANRYLVPILPRAQPLAPAFTLGRLRLAVQRLYLVALPVYVPFMQRQLSLATWENHSTSLLYCSIYWALWWQNLLSPSLCLYILFALLKRRIFPYPSLEDLLRHREEVLRADEFGERVSAKLSASSSSVMEIWRLFRLFEKTKRNIVKGKPRETTKDKSTTDEPEGRHSSDLVEDDVTVLDDIDDSEEAKDLKRIGLEILEDIAELHERVRNLFIWRRPASSRRYAFVLFAVFLTTMLPTRYIAKLAFFVLGFIYWHVIPIIASLPPSERRRLPTPLCDVPNDAEYAMELISQRVAAGLPINPTKSSKNSKKQQSTDSLEVPNDPSKSKSDRSRSRDNSIDWKKWGDRVAIGKSVINDMRRLKPGKAWPVHESWPPRHPIIPGIVGMVQPRSNVDARTYPCQHTSGPGLITLTHNTLLFIPLMSQSPKLTIRLASIKGVKKSGLLKGLQIRWNASTEEKTKEMKEDKFIWVGERDEVFARLVGSDGKRWMKV
ncbi:hypothetical protein CVT25_001942 [Psilocybe cyanescens]|uniref:Uncharacterized protein n=1 Tax=Psilocybe cyanescens TaxID=93625 RepID=A0A409WQP5_PSICY|nr:hypothetical protein CVT25_001942 [Psilocybe cyanescens]